GNSGATYKNDFVELFNPGASPVSLSGWAVQYASASGTSWQVTTLSGTIDPGHYYLVQEAAGSGGTTSLPTPDSTGSISMSATAGKVALVSSTTALTGSCPTGFVDLVGFGTANCFQGTAATTAPSNTTAVLRNGNGCSNSHNNSADFATGAPNPRNASSAAFPCAGSMPPSGAGAAVPASIESGDTVLLTVTVTSGSNPSSTGLGVTADLSAIGGSATQTFYDDGATGGDATAADNVFSYQAVVSGAPGTLSFPATITDAQSRSGSASISVKVISPVPADHHLAIHDIQGPGDASPYDGQRIATEGIVTLRKSNGFFIQAPESEYDANSNTSEGVFVFTSSAPPASAQVGNRVKVVGTVQEFAPSSDPLSPPTTEIGLFEIANTITTGNPLPAAINLTAADVPPTGKFDQLEKYEGMRVHVDSLTATGPTEGSINEANATSTSFGTFDGVITGYPRPFREPGIEDPDPIPNPPCCIPRFDANPERIRVNTTGSGTLEVSTGAVVTNLTGPLDYQFRTYMIDTEPGAAIASPGMSIIPARAPDGSEFTIATMNLERFFDTADDPSVSDVVLTSTAFNHRLNKVSLAIRNVLHLPDVIGVEEMENIGALTALADKINADAPGAGYQPFLVEGNDIGGIDVGFLVKSTVSVADVQQYGKSDNYFNPATGDPYIVSGHPDVLNDRPPLVLAATISANGQTLPFCVVVNHLRSLSGVDSVTDDRVRQKRLQESQFLANLINSLQSSGSPQSCGGNVVSVGDYNAYELNDGYVDVIGTLLGTADPTADMAAGTVVPTGLSDLAFTLPPEKRYSYVFDATAQILDHVLVNTAMNRRVTDFQYAHNNADFPESLRNDANRSERYSDHDMGIAYFALPVAPPVLSLPANLTVEATGPNGAAVNFNATADSNGTPTAVTCNPASGATFPLGVTNVTCSSSDARGNTANGSFTITVQDTTPPLVTVTGVTQGATYLLGNVPTAGCSASDAVSGVTVQPTVAISGGNSNGVGPFTATCSGAQDGAGNTTPPVSVTYTVGYLFDGFLPPAGNPAKAGSTVPLKWTLADASGALIGNLGAVASLKVASCANPLAAVNASATGGTILRFDPLTRQFTFNWSTKAFPAGCYYVLLTLDDGLTHSISLSLR
ncbi:MAG TPA: PxKF domain-containing protein, partial [Terriglobales bacterium]|nr:PxKF domain-containing protein [Terriglobales bacterium]